MKRLLTQFDQQRRHATVATPTCCCCCCCVTSIATSTAVTVVNVVGLAGEARVPASRRWLYGVAAFLVLPVAFLVVIAAAFAINAIDSSAVGVVAVTVGIAAWSALLALLYRKVGLARSGRVVSITVGAGFLLFVGDLIGGGLAIIASGEDSVGPLLYLLLALGLPFLLVPLLRRGMGLRGNVVEWGPASMAARRQPERDPAQAPVDAEQRARDQLEQDLKAAKLRAEAGKERTRRSDRRPPRP